MSAEKRALEKKLADINQLLAASGNLYNFAARLVEKEFLNYSRMSSILNTLGHSNSQKVSQLMDSVMAQVEREPMKFKDFTEILSEDTALRSLAQDLTKTYSTWSACYRRPGGST